MIGKVVSHYKIISKLGGGGMGVVYKAHDQKLDRAVALKFLPAHMGHQPEQRMRFMREAKAASALDHPNICTIYDLDDTPEGQTFIAMSFCDGEPLDAVVARGPLAIDAVVRIARQVADALANAHAKGVVHRDIKPANVIITPAGGATVIDFGLAKLAGDTGLTAEGAMVGTAAYMSPEQVQGTDVDPRTDIWSLGAIMYEMIAGVRPFQGEHAAAVLYQIVNQDPPALPSLRADIPELLAEIVHRAMAKDPADRFPTMGALVAALDATTSETTTTTAPPVSQRASCERAYDALASRDWSAACVAFEAADARGELDVEDLEAWADTAVLLNRVDICIPVRERAHTLYAKTGKNAQAARTAIILARDHLQEGERSVCNGWLKRAEKLLEGLPDCVERGHLARLQAQIAIEADHDLETAMTQTAIVAEVAERHGDTELAILATQDRGRILVLQNRVDEGMALLDEAMATAMSGEHPFTLVGSTYCNMISTCKTIADYRRAGEWSDQALRWCDTYSDSPFPGICCVHRAEVMRVRGEWTAAEDEAERAVSRMDGRGTPVAAEAFYVKGEIKLRRGEYGEAETLFQEAHIRGRHPMPGLALLRVAQGNRDAARALIDRALSECKIDLDRIHLLFAGVEIALAADDLPAARSRAEELGSVAAKFQSPVFSADAAFATGIVALADGNAEAALASLATAREKWSAADMPYEAARARLQMARAYRLQGETDLAELEARAARATFDKLGATADRDRVDELLADQS